MVQWVALCNYMLDLYIDIDIKGAWVFYVCICIRSLVHLSGHLPFLPGSLLIRGRTPGYLDPKKKKSL